MNSTVYVKKAIRMIHDSVNASNLSSIAAGVGFSSDHFNKVFREYTGFNINEYIRFVRLHHAALILRTTKKSITDVAYDCGYETPESFSRAFRKMYGNSPRKYRVDNAGRTFFVYETGITDAFRIMPSFKFSRIFPIYADKAVDSLLLKDAKRLGCDLIRSVSNGCAAYGDDPDGVGECTVLTKETPYSAPIIFAVVEDLSALEKHFEELTAIDPMLINLTVLDDGDPDGVTSIVSKHPGVRLARREIFVYSGAEFETKEKEGFTVREQSAKDADAIIEFMKHMYPGTTEAQISKKKLAIPFLQSVTDRPMMLFHKQKAVGVAHICPLELRGFKVNVYIRLKLLPEYDTDEINEFFYMTAANRLVCGGYILYEENVYRGAGAARPKTDLEKIGFSKVDGCYSIGFEQ